MPHGTSGIVCGDSAGSLFLLDFEDSDGQREVQCLPDAAHRVHHSFDTGDRRVDGQVSQASPNHLDTVGSLDSTSLSSVSCQQTTELGASV